MYMYFNNLNDTQFALQWSVKPFICNLKRDMSLMKLFNMLFKSHFKIDEMLFWCEEIAVYICFTKVKNQGLFL